MFASLPLLFCLTALPLPDRPSVDSKFEQVAPVPADREPARTPGQTRAGGPPGT